MEGVWESNQQLPDECVFVLRSEEKEAITHLVASLKHQLSQAHCNLTPRQLANSFDKRVLEVVEKGKLLLPERLRKAILTFRDHSNPYGVLVVRGLDVGEAELPDTPSGIHHQEGGELPEKKHSSLSEYTLLLLTCLLGEPITYSEARSIGSIQTVVPVKGKERENAYMSSLTSIGLHTEFSFHPVRPDYVNLLCLRGDHEGKAVTPVSSIAHAVTHLTAEEIAALQRPHFKFTATELFGTNLTGWSLPPFAILTPDPRDGQPALRIQRNGVECVGGGAEAESALLALRKALAEGSIGVALRSGDLAMIDNNKAAHARSAFTPRYDGQDRWLQRIWIRREMPEERMFMQHPQGGKAADEHRVIAPFVELVQLLAAEENK